MPTVAHHLLRTVTRRRAVVVSARSRGVIGVLDVVTGMLTGIRRRRRGVRVVVASGVVVDGVVVMACVTLVVCVACAIRVALARVVTRLRFLCAVG